MKKKMEYSNAPKAMVKTLLEGEVVTDFLPPPSQLVKKQSKVKVTISLNTRSVNFFKHYAKKHNVKYQTMINEVLDLYAQKYSHE